MAHGNGGWESYYGPYGQNHFSGSEPDALQRARTKSPGNGRSSPGGVFNPYYTGRPRTPVTQTTRTLPIDRQEIIKRIKGNGSRSVSPELERPVSRSMVRKRHLPNQDKDAGRASSRPTTPEMMRQNQAAGVEIERPRSALHRGDFREQDPAASAIPAFPASATPDQSASLSTSPVAPWHPAFPSTLLRQFTDQTRANSVTDRVPVYGAEPPHRRTRAASHASLASSFTYKMPTSPLVQSSRPDTPEPPLRQHSRSPDKSRRHTFSPQALQRLRSPSEYHYQTSAHPSTQPPLLRSERTYPYQAHQPRRSLNATAFHSLPQTPDTAGRRPSWSESPLHLAPMVGSYEESILRGRMSTTPSRPLNFVAQIGVLGKGDCKPSLKCPKHVSIPFPAVFYSYATTTRSTAANDQPSPYVGLIDIKNSTTNTEDAASRRQQRVRAAVTSSASRAGSQVREDASTSDNQKENRRQRKQKRRSGSPRAPDGSSYRIPQQGQLQIVIKNPNKTAVKLFLVPYDLSDIQPGQKTFIRQRSYSAGPIIDMPLSHRKNLGTDRPEAALNPSDDPDDKPMLRYLVHLNICCPSKGRFYLYKSIRVVFANRVPDGKEKLRNEIQLPEPRYSAYRPGRESLPNLSSSATHKGQMSACSTEGVERSAANGRELWQCATHSSLPAEQYLRNDHPPQPFPFTLSTLPTLDSRPASRQTNDKMDLDSDRSYETQSLQSTLSSPRSRDGQVTPIKTFPRLDNPFCFERDHSRERQSGQRSESLLSRRLMDLAVQGSMISPERWESTVTDRTG